MMRRIARLAYTPDWRHIATFRHTDTDPKERFLPGNAGLGGFGGSSYIDAVVLIDRDLSNGWAGAADGTLERRDYVCQNWRHDVSAIVTDTGKMVEWAKYSAYGVPFGLPAGDTDSDGDWDATDSGNITGSYDVRKDANLDGTIDSADITHANSITGGYHTMARGVLSAVGNRRGYAGYDLDPSTDKYHVRFRVYDPDLGRWTRRDPLGYVDGMSLYEYVAGMAIVATDPHGLEGQPQPLTPAQKNCLDCVNWCSANDPLVQKYSKEATEACNGEKPNVYCPPPGDPNCPGNSGYTCCQDNAIVICDTGASCDKICLVLRHELIHVIQNCKWGKKCNGCGTTLSHCEQCCREINAHTGMDPGAWCALDPQGKQNFLRGIVEAYGHCQSCQSQAPLLFWPRVWACAWECLPH